MNALVLVAAHKLGFMGKRQVPMLSFRLLWAGVDAAQPVRKRAAVVTMAYDKR